VDVPNASLMVIEHAERFGLSQLHQLRGRVGRGAAASACVLLYSTGDSPRLGETARERLRPWPRPTTASRLPGATWRFAAPASFWARASRAMRCCALPTWPPIPTCWNGRAKLAPRMLDRTPAWRSATWSAGSMTLTELKYIVAVARERHFGRAAEACFVSQPTLSVAIKKLEEELDVKLFERSASEVSVTPLGEEIVRQAQSVLEQAAAIKEIAKRGKDPLAGPLRWA
jgi:DNA-binding MarR family transcriptional regulator